MWEIIICLYRQAGFPMLRYSTWSFQNFKSIYFQFLFSFLPTRLFLAPISSFYLVPNIFVEKKTLFLFLLGQFSNSSSPFSIYSSWWWGNYNDSITWNLTIAIEYTEKFLLTQIPMNVPKYILDVLYFFLLTIYKHLWHLQQVLEEKTRT